VFSISKIQPMLSLQSLRETRAIIRWMLASFLLSIGAAIATPLIQPQTLSLVCSTGGGVAVVVSQDGTITPADEAGHTLQCVMCLPGGAPPVADFVLALPTALALSRPEAPPAPAHWRLAEPTSARDPPVFI
jgi:hypothetical protein